MLGSRHGVLHAVPGAELGPLHTICICLLLFEAKPALVLMEIL